MRLVLVEVKMLFFCGVISFHIVHDTTRQVTSNNDDHCVPSYLRLQIVHVQLYTTFIN